MLLTPGPYCDSNPSGEVGGGGVTFYKQRCVAVFINIAFRSDILRGGATAIPEGTTLNINNCIGCSCQTA